MKTPHYKYYWELINNNVIVCNVRTNTAYRIMEDNERQKSNLNSDFWFELVSTPENIKHWRDIHGFFSITRKQVREWQKNNTIPTPKI